MFIIISSMFIMIASNRERRNAANARERKRMNQMTRAYGRLKEKLPNNEHIQSKKQIVDQVLFTSEAVESFIDACSLLA